MKVAALSNFFLLIKTEAAARMDLGVSLWVSKYAFQRLSGSWAGGFLASGATCGAADGFEAGRFRGRGRITRWVGIRVVPCGATTESIALRRSSLRPSARE